MKQFIPCIFLFVSLLGYSQEFEDKNKTLLNNLVKNHIEHLSNGDVAKYIDGYSTNYTDLGGGPNGDGTINFTSWKEKLKEFVASKEFEKIKGKSIEQLLDLEKKEILNYQETIAKNGSMDRFSFVLREGDYLVSFPPKDESALFDGWFSIYRLENENWKIIAGD